MFTSLTTTSLCVKLKSKDLLFVVADHLVVRTTSHDIYPQLNTLGIAAEEDQSVPWTGINKPIGGVIPVLTHIGTGIPGGMSTWGVTFLSQRY